MQIILKQLPDRDYMGLFDTRSNQFIKGGNVKNTDDTCLLDLANSIANKSPRTILNIVQNWEHDDDHGYCEPMIASAYLDINPDIRELAKQMLTDKPVQRTRRKKIEKPVDIDPETGEEVVKVKGKPGRPRRVYTEAEVESKNNAPKRGRGRPKKEGSSNPKTIVYVDGVKRGRGRPRKYPLEMTI
jgi:hypothetical protein